METSALGHASSGRYLRLASPIHTILVLAALGGWAFAHKLSADHLRAGAHSNRVRSSHIFSSAAETRIKSKIKWSSPLNLFTR